ncbi:hypothetical protein V1517DRAFT_336999 [Lipomyces orientalis]|uniref:Uncharacterized protein n=1 Tax=Lipomyces orientalis TaxID=1233043 RepID=A0ACC3TTZ7_9ASCO
MPPSPIVITPPPLTTTSPENISSRSTATISYSPSSKQDQSSATLSSPQPLVSRLRSLAPAPPQGTTPMAPPPRLSSNSTTPTFSSSSTTGSSASSRAAGSNVVTASSPRGQTVANDPADEEDWEDIPAAAIREMDQNTAQHQLFRANAAIRRLRSSLSVARTATTRYRFDSRVLRFETEESLKRYQVENFIIKRQVDILRVNLLRARPSDQKPSESEMAARIEADKYRWRLIRAKSRLFETQKMLEAKEMEIGRLRQRIGGDRLQREGRVKKGRSSHAGVARFGQNHNSKQGTGTNDDEGALAALGILASQVLSQQQIKSSDEETSCQETNRRPTAQPEREIGAISAASSITTAQRAMAQVSVTTQAADSDTDVSATDVEHTDTELDDQFEDAEEALAPTASHSRMKSAESKADTINDNKAATEQIVDNGEDLNISTLERATSVFRKSDNTDNFDPDETIEVRSSPVALATFRSINERRSPRKLNLENQDSESLFRPRKKLKHKRRRSSASTVSESESVSNNQEDMLIPPSARLKQKQSSNPKKLRV